jgi:hypothetical protein
MFGYGIPYNLTVITFFMFPRLLTDPRLLPVGILMNFTFASVVYVPSLLCSLHEAMQFFGEQQATKRSPGTATKAFSKAPLLLPITCGTLIICATFVAV